MMTTDKALPALSAQNHGLILTRDLKQMGYTDDALRTLRKRLHRIARGAYVLTPPATRAARHSLQVRATVERHFRLVAASHVSAAVVHELPSWNLDLRQVHVTGLDGEVREGIRHGVHTHHGLLGGDELVEVLDLPVTSVPRTIIDCARLAPLTSAVVIADDALRRGLVTSDELNRRLGNLSTLQGIEGVRRMLALIDERSESPGETRTRLILVNGGIEVDPQVEIRDSSGDLLGRVDFKVRGSATVVEFDGRSKYQIDGDMEEALWQEKQRHDAIGNAGYVVVRVTWADLDNPNRLVRRVRQAIARAAREL